MEASERGASARPGREAGLACTGAPGSAEGMSRPMKEKTPILVGIGLVALGFTGSYAVQRLTRPGPEPTLYSFVLLVSPQAVLDRRLDALMDQVGAPLQQMGCPPGQVLRETSSVQLH